jgi:hypothetical protein
MQDQQAKEKLLVESSGKPFSVDISTEKGQMAPQFMANSTMDKRMGQRPPSFESGAQNGMGGYQCIQSGQMPEPEPPTAAANDYDHGRLPSQAPEFYEEERPLLPRPWHQQRSTNQYAQKQ